MSEARPYIQSDFFGVASERRDQALSHLKSLAFHEAQARFEEACSLDPYLPNAAFFRKLIETGLAAGLDSSSPADTVLKAWACRPAPEPEPESSDPQCAVSRYFSALLAERILSLDPFDSEDLVRVDDIPYPAAVFLLQTERFREALDRISRYLRHANESQVPAHFWGYLGDAAYALNRWRQANIAYLRILITSPAAVDWRTFRHHGLTDLFATLAQQHGSEKAYPLWAYYAWADGILHVSPQNQFVLEAFRQQSSPSLPTSPTRRLHVFTLHALAEQVDKSPSVDPAHREQMQAIAPELFQDYLGRLRH